MIKGLSAGENKLRWTLYNGQCEASDEVIITVIDLFIPSVITPNDDGKNDYFNIQGGSADIELIIFNRWGLVEYANDNYVNDWNGFNNNHTELPDDTYFYVVKLKNGDIIKGSVLIKR
jgi:gliding motility-associated-like protein